MDQPGPRVSELQATRQSPLPGLSAPTVELELDILQKVRLLPAQLCLALGEECLEAIAYLYWRSLLVSQPTERDRRRRCTVVNLHSQ